MWKLKNKEKIYIKKYGEYEGGIIVKLEKWADKLNDYLDKKLEVTREEVDESYQYLRTVQSLKDIGEQTIRYAEYLEGATLELVESFPDDDILIENVKEEEIETMMHSMSNAIDWVSVEEMNKDNHEKLNELALKYTRGKVHEILKNRENKWALLFGIIHAKQIRKKRGNIKKFMFNN